ncbi:hypothetical protein KP509_01G061600 [Ceratopteris richardii]|uniref:HECT-type E3 ubiquitin transferase n=1 Tax=Ceratopteris richardii TaxID=49495 RepID=A0A8T2VH31_CERRI|nr:hypothetical protein KP509_01G061600 [Ceratopteris richardii]KAH7446551.1 hypothetical protein KP509_01G061600 [Ceratopteris richardii]
METRSRKRAEATGDRPSPVRRGNNNSSNISNKRARFSGPNIPLPLPVPRLPSRSAFSRLHPTIASVSRIEEVTMDSPSLPSSSSGSKHSKKEIEKDEDYNRKSASKEKEAEKGKEKEMRSADRDRGTPHLDDDHHDVEGNSSLQHNIASASSALHGLLRKLGAGLDDLLPTPSPHQSSKLKRILSGLKADGEEGRQLEALSQLCELLSIGTEESLSSFSVDSFVPVLVGLLNHEYNADMMLLAARALTHLCDVLPSSCAAVVHYGAVPCLCARLLTIEYIDLAEQSLQALEKISHEHPAACLRAGALLAVLSYLDFFSTGVQRVAVSTAANICRQLPADASDFVIEAVPILTNLLHYQDSKVVDHASVCLTRIADSFASSSEKLDMLCSHGLIPQAVRLVSVNNSNGAMVSQTSLNHSTYTGLIRLLSTCASGSAAAAESLLLLNISSIIKDILAGSGVLCSSTVSPLPAARSPEQLYEIVTLVNELLPLMPQLSAPQNGMTTPRNLSSRKGLSAKPDDVPMREKLLQDHPELLAQFGKDLFPVLIQVYGSSVNPPIRHKCLAAMSKLVHFSTAEMLRSLFKDLNISSFLGGVLALKDPSILLAALQMAETLMQKLPDVFTKLFVKEGVVHAIDNLIANDYGNTSPQPPSSGKNLEGAGGITDVAPGRPRRGNRRRGSGSLASESPPEEIKGSSHVPVGSPSVGTPDALLQTSKRSAVIAAAKHFKETHFAIDSGIADVAVTESLSRLKALCQKMDGENVPGGKGKWKGKGKVTGSSAASDDTTIAAVAELLTELNSGDGVSTFEFVGSGVVSSLLNFLSCGDHSKENLSDVRVRQQALDRLKQFVSVALSPSSEQGAPFGDPPVKILVRKLQSALASLERFPVVLSHIPRSGSTSASVAAGLGALAQPFKLRLCRAPGERGLRDYSLNIVLIDPLATLSSIEDFLWSRVQRSDTSNKASISSSSEGTQPNSESPNTSTRMMRPSTRSRSFAAVAADNAATPAASKGKAKMGILGSFETRGPETRNAAARRRGSRISTPSSKQSQGESATPGSEEDDLEVSPAEFDEAVAMDEDDLSEEVEDEEQEEVRLVFGEGSVSSCLRDQVHAVRLGVDSVSGIGASTSTVTEDSSSKPSGFITGVSGIHLGSRATVVTGGLDTNESRTGTSVVSRNSLSFAAAAMAGLASASGKGLRAGRERRSLGASSSSAPTRLAFSLGGKPLNRTWTIFQAIQRQAIAEEDDEERFTGADYSSGEGKRLWDEVYTIHYQRAECTSQTGVVVPSTSSSSSTPIPVAQSNGSAVSELIKSTEETCLRQQSSLLDSILQGELPCDLDKTNSTYKILLLLRVLEALNRLSPRLHAQALSDAYAEGRITEMNQHKASVPVVSQEEFLSTKLTPKLARQMQDALALCSGGLPAWCSQLTRACPFLFPFETRRQYFYATAFGLSRALQRLQQLQSADNPSASNERELRIGRLQRQKVRVSRNRILDSAAKVMELYSSHKAVLEVEYFGEVGTGLGPTLEFYTLLSHDLQKVSLDMWRSSSTSSAVDEIAHGGDIDMQDADSEFLDESTGSLLEKDTDFAAFEADEHVIAPYGLFPRPFPPTSDASAGSKYARVLEHFRLLGRTMGKALQDGRLLDLPLSTAFHKLILGQELDIYDMQHIDPELGTTLQEMQNLVRRKKFLETSSDTGKQAVLDLRFRDVKVEDLCLDFTLPGYSDYLLKPDGRNIGLTLENLEEYVALVVDSTLKSGIAPQLDAFRSGFNEVFQVSSLQIFNEEELDYLLCGCREVWTADTLVEHIKFDHGYTSTSPPIRNLLEIMAEFTPEQQRAFLRFVTGAPRLPSGGLAALNPKLTIVRKHPTGVAGTAAVLGSTPPGTSALGTPLADGDLPSVMTCANYLKLPPYSCKEIMRERLLFAISEGQGSFDLS